MEFNYSAFIIFLIFFVPLYLFWRWIFRKTASKPKRIALTLSLAIVTVPAIYFLLVFAWIFTVSYYPNRNFDRKAWMADSDKRYEYTQDLIDSKLLIGKTHEEVEQILGRNSDTSRRKLKYYIGSKPSIIVDDPSSLTIHFKNGKVDTVKEVYR